MERKTIQYFDWLDVRKAICEEMRIDDDEFENYSRSNFNLQEEFFYYFCTNINNDSKIVKMNPEPIETMLEWINCKNRLYLKPFIIAVYNVFEKYYIKYVRYEW